MFPLSIDGELELSSPAPDGDVLAVLRIALASEKARNIVTDGRRVTFEAGILRLVSNWNVLVPVGSGSIEIVPGQPRRVRYAFSCRQMLVVTTAMSLAMGAVAAKQGGFLLFSAAAWAWLFGMNYFVAAWRLPGFVRGSVLNIP